MLTPSFSFPLKTSLIPSNIHYVAKKSDFPTPVSGVITLPANTAWELSAIIDLAGDRIVTGPNVAIYSPFFSIGGLVSTGLTADYLLTCTGPTQFGNITISAAKVFYLDGSAYPQLDIRWDKVFFLNCTELGVLNSVFNCLWQNCGFINCAGLLIQGTLSFFGISFSSISVPVGQTFCTVASNAIVAHSFGWAYLAFAVPPTSTGINLPLTVPVPTESYVIDTVKFEGGGTYLVGYDYLSSSANFSSSVGVQNSVNYGSIYIHNGATQTTFLAASTFVKMLGTTTLSADTAKFSMPANNRLHSTFVIQKKYQISVNVSFYFPSANNQTVEFGLYFSRASSIDTSSTYKITSQTNGRRETISFITHADLQNGDYFELWIANNTSTNPLIVEDYKLSVIEIK